MTMPKNRTPKYSTAQIVEALRASHGLVTKAAEKLGCAASTIYERKRGEQAIQAVIDESREEIVDHAELALRSAVLDRQPWAVALVLRTIGRKRGYVERQEISGPEGKELVVNIVRRPAEKPDRAIPDTV